MALDLPHLPVVLLSVSALIAFHFYHSASNTCEAPTAKTPAVSPTTVKEVSLLDEYAEETIKCLVEHPRPFDHCWNEFRLKTSQAVLENLKEHSTESLQPLEFRPSRNTPQHAGPFEIVTPTFHCDGQLLYRYSHKP